MRECRFGSVVCYSGLGLVMILIEGGVTVLGKRFTTFFSLIFCEGKQLAALSEVTHFTLPEYRNEHRAFSLLLGRGVDIMSYLCNLSGSLLHAVQNVGCLLGPRT